MPEFVAVLGDVARRLTWSATLLCAALQHQQQQQQLCCVRTCLRRSNLTGQWCMVARIADADVLVPIETMSFKGNRGLLQLLNGQTSATYFCHMSAMVGPSADARCALMLQVIIDRSRT